MKKKLTLSVLLLFTVLSFSQDFKEKREKIKALKVRGLCGLPKPSVNVAFRALL